jgi:hypothetical protein
MDGPGKYDDICTEVREKAEANTAIVIIIGGKRGHGFSVQTHSQTLLPGIPHVLRNIADQIAKDIGLVQVKEEKET